MMTQWASWQEKSDLLTANPILCLNPNSILLYFYYAIKWITVYEFIPRHIIAFISHQRTWDRQKILPYWLFSETQLFRPIRYPRLRFILGTEANLPLCQYRVARLSGVRNLEVSSELRTLICSSPSYSDGNLEATQSQNPEIFSAFGDSVGWCLLGEIQEFGEVAGKWLTHPWISHWSHGPGSQGWSPGCWLKKKVATLEARIC